MKGFFSDMYLLVLILTEMFCTLGKNEVDSTVTASIMNGWIHILGLDDFKHKYLPVRYQTVISP